MCVCPPHVTSRCVLMRHDVIWACSGLLLLLSLLPPSPPVIESIFVHSYLDLSVEWQVYFPQSSIQLLLLSDVQYLGD